MVSLRITSARAGRGSREESLAQTRIRHARYQPFSAVIGLTCVDDLLPASVVPERLGVVVAGGCHHVPNAWRFAEHAHTEGPRYLNPLAFPSILPSAVASCIAATIEARAFSLTVGYDHRAFVQAIERSTRLIIRDFADDVMVVAVSDDDLILTNAAASAEFSLPSLDVACVHLSRYHLPDACELLNFGDRIDEWGECETRIVDVAYGSLSGAKEIRAFMSGTATCERPIRLSFSEDREVGLVLYRRKQSLLEREG